MTLPYKIAAVATALLASFAIGRRSVSQPDITKTVTTQEDKHKDLHETVVIVKAPDGTVTTTKTLDTVTDTKKSSEVDLKQVAAKTSKINISALVGTDLTKSGITPIYGVSANKEFIGPITIGVFGLTSGTVGITIGLNF